MEWSGELGKACYDGLNVNYPLSQQDVLILGDYNTITFTITDLENGKLILDSILGKPEYTDNGTYTITGIATQSNLTFIPSNLGSGIFDGCITGVSVINIPHYEVLLDDVVVYTHEGIEGVTIFGEFVQYELDWNLFALLDGYTIRFIDGLVSYQTPCFCITEDQCKHLVLEWTNNSSSYGFNYSELDFTQKVRVIGRLWKPAYPKDKEVSRDNAGYRSIVYSVTDKKYILSLEALPEYLHDAIAIGLEHDSFFVNDLALVDETDAYEPDWVNESNLAPVEVELYKKFQNLKNQKCQGTLE